MKKFLQEFKTFALRGNVMDLAVGVMIGAAFQDIVKSLTEDVLSRWWAYLSRRILVCSPLRSTALKSDTVLSSRPLSILFCWPS